MTKTVVLNGNTYSDGSNDGGVGNLFLGNGGHRDNLIDMFSDTVVEVTTATSNVALTNADVVLTGLDVTATGNAVSATNADVVTTNADVVLTNNKYDEFDDRWLGDKAADPTLDNTGNALLTGAAYYNTGIDKIKLYNGANWATIQDGITDVVSDATPQLGGDLDLNGFEILGLSTAWVVKTVDYTASTTDAILIDTSSGAISITLPVTPLANAFIKFADNGHSLSSNKLTILRNGSNIQSLAEDLSVSTNGISFDLVYIDAIRGWVIT